MISHDIALFFWVSLLFKESGYMYIGISFSHSLSFMSTYKRLTFRCILILMLSYVHPEITQ